VIGYYDHRANARLSARIAQSLKGEFLPTVDALALVLRLKEDEQFVAEVDEPVNVRRCDLPIPKPREVAHL